ncbi:MAG: type IV toxin-antitoxin system AbiEi family antitoxin domain-containing protein [Propionibacteriaceae bacterium]|nr:type IV toxin-antitoxin system AbiEi family antitoxin domain-containing protein [Propionibacteriaceae bacterium]
MKTVEALKTLSGTTVAQWGMVTTAQAARVGVTRLQLSRLTEQGHLERIGHGLYRDTGTPLDRFDSVKAAWLSINPSLTAQERLALMPADAVASGATAAYLLGLGDLVPEPYEFTVRRRRQTQRPELVFRVRQLLSNSVTLREGIPVTTPEQTVADLVGEGMDKSLVADVLADIETIDFDGLVELLSPLAERNGHKADNGQALYDELERLAGRDVDSLARAVADTPLAAKIAAAYVKSISPDAMKSITESMQSMLHTLASNLQASEAWQQTAEELLDRLATVAMPPETRAAIGDLQERLASAVITPETLTVIRDLQEGVVKSTVPPARLDGRTTQRLVDAATRKRPPRALAPDDANNDENEES